MSDVDRFNLERFVRAQGDGGIYDSALAELERGRKGSHWMWFVFPQIAGLGTTATSQRYAIASLEEAREYLRHPVLGPRLLECAEVLDTTQGRTATEILGVVDAKKLRSSVTLFLRAEPREPIFQRVLDQYFDGVADSCTDTLLQ